MLHHDNRVGFASVWFYGLLLLLPSLAAAAPASDRVDCSTLQGKVLLGYQGWFGCRGDGSPENNWRSWAHGTPTAETLTVEMYPDLSEFDRDELYPVPKMTVGGKQAYLYSAWNRKTVLRHFRWMKEYGLDGVLAQRFVVTIGKKRSGGDVVLKNIIAGAEASGRTFAIEYDISQADPATFWEVMRDDWIYLVDVLKVTSHPNYLQHNGKPVLSIWGMGFEEDHHPPTDPAVADRIIEWLRSKAPAKYQVTYMGGVPSRWRFLGDKQPTLLVDDAHKGLAWAETYKRMDVIQPWSVGRYRNDESVDRWKEQVIAGDVALTAKNGQLYMPVIFPGFSWHNLRRQSPQNWFPRDRGEFFWRQACNAKAAGATMLKIAMFDEVNEGTAILKLAAHRSDAPDQGYWLTLDADGGDLKSDHYLRLAGEITRMFRGEIPATSPLPKNPGPPWKAPAGGSKAN
jgi:hypothetical protein